jgi:hypothetical protein
MSSLETSPKPHGTSEEDNANRMNLQSIMDDKEYTPHTPEKSSDNEDDNHIELSQRKASETHFTH